MRRTVRSGCSATAGEPLFEFLGYVDDRRPRPKGAIILGISATPELLGEWTQELASPVHQ